MRFSLERIIEVLMIFFAGVLLFVMPVLTVVGMLQGSLPVIDGLVTIVIYLILGAGNAWIVFEIRKDRLAPF